MSESPSTDIAVGDRVRCDAFDFYGRPRQCTGVVVQVFGTSAIVRDDEGDEYIFALARLTRET
jgi:hypothetical protein